MKATLLGILLLCASCMAQARPPDSQLVTIYAYHLKPPFIVDLQQRQGLYYDFAAYLNSKGERYHFHTEFLPRNRLEHDLDRQLLEGMVIGVTPAWFDDPLEQNYLWTPGIFHDQDEIVSLPSLHFNYSDPHSLSGMRLAGVLGFSYAGIDQLVDAGEILRSNTAGEREVLQMILKGRVDVGIISRSTLDYLTAVDPKLGRLYVSPVPHDVFERRILIPQDMPQVQAYLLPIIEQMHSDPAWRAILHKYRAPPTTRHP
ncbi:substrate-binding periplasmic protein [Pseudomonas zhanjiangensis]|uniref:Substrate-binding periplasmic protein n=1 Tax=Pseudomonas zhanjiangensis TaxID=3239015 RepID=A0ABV3YQI4_9PSED